MNIWPISEHIHSSIFLSFHPVFLNLGGGRDDLKNLAPLTDRKSLAAAFTTFLTKSCNFFISGSSFFHSCFCIYTRNILLVHISFPLVLLSESLANRLVLILSEDVETFLTVTYLRTMSTGPPIHYC